MENQENERLWKLAGKRADFRRNLAFYFIINLFMIAIWYFTGGKEGGHFWPVWAIIASGFGVIIQYIRVYHTDTGFSVEKEYEKLKKETNRN